MGFDVTNPVFGVSLKAKLKPVSKATETSSHLKQILITGPRREKTCLRGFANNKGADQPAHPRSLISAFVIRILDSIISKLATGEISIFYLVCVARETGLSLAFSETRRQVLSRRCPYIVFHKADDKGAGQSLKMCRLGLAFHFC